MQTAPIAGTEKLRPFFKYYGGKFRVAPRYPAPKHKTIVEPFAGAAGYSVRYHWHDVVLCDKSPIICGIWDYLIKASAEEILALPDLQFGEEVSSLNICQEAKWLIGFWANPGCASPRDRLSSFARFKMEHDGIERQCSVWGPSARRRIASQVDSIRHWQVFNVDYRDCPISGPATWFIDPPYAAMGKCYPYGSRQMDFADLADWSTSRNGQVVVCEAEGADWLPFEPFGKVKSTHGASSEVVWIKDDQPTAA